MRIEMSGSFYLWDFEEAIDLIIQTLEMNQIDEIRSVSLEFQPYDHCTLVDFEDQECGAPFRILRNQGRKTRKFKVVSPRLLPETKSRPVFSGPLIMPPPAKKSATLQNFFGMLGNAKVDAMTKRDCSEDFL